MLLQKGDNVPDFTLPSDEGKEISLSDFKGKKLVVYFYPKDNTPGCTVEACDFRDNMDRLASLNVAIVGISKDSVKSHVTFKQKQNLNFSLLSDDTGQICEKFGVWAEKSMMGKKYMGIVRSTFLVNENGKIIKIWRDVRVKGHVDDILESLGNL